MYFSVIHGYVYLRVRHVSHRLRRGVKSEVAGSVFEGGGAVTLSQIFQSEVPPNESSKVGSIESYCIAAFNKYTDRSISINLHFINSRK